MKILYLNLFTLLVVIISTSTVFSQCIDINEDDFDPGNICATEAAPNSGPLMSNQIDVWDLAAGASGADGIPDLQLCYEAVVSNPNANGTCDDGDFYIGAGWGGSGHSNCDGSGSGDFGGSTTDDCVCENGYIIMTVKFLNGFCAEAGTFMFNATSQNGSSEAYEYGFGFVTQATDANGAPIAGLNTQAQIANISNYCNAQYAGGMTVSSTILTSPTGVFTTQADDFNATVNDCATSGQSGEDTGSGSGHNSGLGTGVNGLAATDLIKEVTYVYGLSNAPGTDCDGDGDTGVGSPPSGSFAGMDICPPPPQCGYTVEPTVTLEESCGVFNIAIGAIDETGASGTGTTVSYSTAPQSPVANTADLVTGAEGLAADGTSYYIQICDVADATCCTEYGPYSIMGSTPNIPAFVPCTTGTTGIGG